MWGMRAGSKRKHDVDETQVVPGSGKLLEQLRYGQVIKRIAEIRKLTKEGMKKIGEEMVLPRIIVIGNESSGKSSTLERIAGQPVLPCDTGICTRAPVVLELKYEPTLLDAEIYFKGFTGDYEKVQNAEEARRKVQAAMDSLKGVGVANDKEVRVKILSQDVPTLELVDLPGIVLARTNEPDNMTQQTVDCTTRFLSSSDTAVVLCIVAAAEPNLRTVKALGLLQESAQYEKLKSSTIGVFAQTDKLYDAAFEDEGRHGPRWKLEARLRGTADDQVHLQHGFVAVKNRNSRSKDKAQDLSGCWSTENAWFDKDSAFRQDANENKAVAEELSDRLGLCALLKKIDTVFCKHLNEHWVPKEVAAVDKELGEIQARHDEVSACVRRLEGVEGGDRAAFRTHVQNRIASVLSDSNLEAWCQAYVQQQVRDTAGAQWDKGCLVACLRGVHKATTDLEPCIKNAHTHFFNVFETALRAEFGKLSRLQTSDPNDMHFIDLRPYATVLEGVLKELSSYMRTLGTKAEQVYKADLDKLHNALLVHRGDLQQAGSGPSLESAVRLVLLQHLLLPCVQGLDLAVPSVPWLPLARTFELFAAGASAFKQQKLQLEAQMKTCDEVKKSLRALSSNI